MLWIMQMLTYQERIEGAVYKHFEVIFKNPKSYNLVLLLFL